VEYTLTVQKGVSTLCRSFPVPQYKKLRRFFEYGLKMHLKQYENRIFQNSHLKTNGS
jgi:hypothetical protein